MVSCCESAHLSELAICLLSAVCYNCCSTATSPAAQALIISPIAEQQASCAAVDTATDPYAPKLAYTAEPEDIQSKTGLAYLHSSHCLGSGDIMVSAMGDPNGKGKGNFVLLDQQLKVRARYLIRPCQLISNMNSVMW